MAESRVLEYRTRLGFRREDLAARSRVSISTVAKLESGKLTRGTAIGVLLDVAHALGLSPSDVWPVLRARPVRKPPGFSRLPVAMGRAGRRMGGEGGEALPAGGARGPRVYGALAVPASRPALEVVDVGEGVTALVPAGASGVDRSG